MRIDSSDVQQTLRNRLEAINTVETSEDASGTAAKHPELHFSGAIFITHSRSFVRTRAAEFYAVPISIETIHSTNVTLTPHQNYKP